MPHVDQVTLSLHLLSSKWFTSYGAYCARSSRGLNPCELELFMTLHS